MKKEKHQILIIMLIACLAMGLVDAVIQPGYFIKSIIKIMLFLILPYLYARKSKQWRIATLFTLKGNGLAFAIACGIGIYILLVGGFVLVF